MKQKKLNRLGVYSVIYAAWNSLGIDYGIIQGIVDEEGWVSLKEEPSLSDLVSNGTRLEYEVDPKDKTNVKVRPFSLRGIVTEQEYKGKVRDQCESKTVQYLIRLGITSHKRVWQADKGYEYFHKDMNYKNPLTWILALVLALIFVGFVAYDAGRKVYNFFKLVGSEFKSFISDTTKFQESYYEE